MLRIPKHQDMLDHKREIGIHPNFMAARGQAFEALDMLVPTPGIEPGTY